MSNIWQTLSRFDVSKEVEQKGKFDYLSWAWAWAYVKEKYPEATFEKHVFRDNQDNPLPFMRDTKGNTFVMVSVTIESITHTEIHYVMDNRNQAIQFPDASAVNKALQRCLVKAIAFHGLGLMSMQVRTCLWTWMRKMVLSSSKLSTKLHPHKSLTTLGVFMQHQSVHLANKLNKE